MPAPDDVYGFADLVIDGNLHVIGAVGEGGFSVVYKAMHLGLREPVAIKCLKLDAGSSPEVLASFTERFFDESRIAYRLSQGNLNIVRSISTGTTLSPSTGKPVPYMVLEWLEGTSFSTALTDRRARGLRGRSLAEVIALFEPAASALAYAHAQGIAHRDVKPGNFFLANTPDGSRLKVLDFGMAKVLDSASMGFSGAATIGGLVVASPRFAAPEQFDPARGAVGARTDVYSLALVLVEALSDRRARDCAGLGQYIVAAMDRTRLPTPRALGVNVTDAVEAIFVAALAVDPAARPRDAGDFWARLKAAATEPEAARAPHPRPDAFALATRVDAPSHDAKATIVQAAAMAPDAALPSTARPPAPTAHGGTLVMAAQVLPAAAAVASPPRAQRPLREGGARLMSPAERASAIAASAVGPDSPRAAAHPPVRDLELRAGDSVPSRAPAGRGRWLLVALAGALLVAALAIGSWLAYAARFGR